jgi:hypothetical protein
VAGVVGIKMSIITGGSVDFLQEILTAVALAQGIIKDCIRILVILGGVSAALILLIIFLIARIM